MTQIDRSYYHCGGPTGILLVHGLGGTPVELRDVAQALARQGYTVHCCQLAGHCASAEDLRRSTWHDWYRSVETGHDTLRRHCRTIIAGGLSMGALLALHLACQRKGQVAGLSWFAQCLHLDGSSMPWYGFLLRYLRLHPVRINLGVVERQAHGIKDERIRTFVLKGMLGNEAEAGTFSTPLRAFAQFNALGAVVRREMCEIDVPTLIFHSRQDDMANLGNALEIQRRLGGPVETLVLDDRDHLVTLDRQRDVVVDRSLEFAERITLLTDLQSRKARGGGPSQLTVGDPRGSW
jgi:carboxylesterase